MNNNIFPVILAGGKGTRFWPVSTDKFPKQFINFGSNNETLLSITAKRIGSITNEKNLYIVTNHQYTELVNKNIPDGQIIPEPVGRNTAPAIALAAQMLNKKFDAGIMIILPADHYINNTAKFIKVINQAINIASKTQALITLGIKPTYPNTGYGYIQAGQSVENEARKVLRFVEKPSLEKAKEYLSQSEFYWNSGMFVWSVDSILRSLEEFLPNVYHATHKISGRLVKDSNYNFEAEFSALPNISIDYGVMEKAQNALVVPAEDLGWSDVGTWDAWAELQNKDSSSNVINGNVYIQNASNCTIYSGNKPVALIGVKDLIVVDSSEGILVCTKDSAQSVKEAASYFEKK